MTLYGWIRWLCLPCALVLLAVLPGAAEAAAPTAADDTLTSYSTGVQDVLGNDADPEAQTLTVVGIVDEPDHGTVTCDALGACFYRAQQGYAGPDTFQYRIGDTEGNTATATVTVDVLASSAPAALLANDDDAATLARRAVQVDVLANDTGFSTAGDAITASSDPPNGTATCPPAGPCTYTPDPGFTGADGFTYTIKDGGGATRSAIARVLVAPGDAGYAATLNGSPDAPRANGDVPPGGTATWLFGAQAAGLSGSELAALPLPALAASTSGPHGVLGGTVVAAPGWTVEGDGTLRATRDALLGDRSTQPFPRPLPPISQGTGGDGHVPVLVGTKVFAFFHHQTRTKVSCVDRATGQVCPGYPKQLDQTADDMPGPAVVDGTKMWVHTHAASQYAQTAPVSLFCWDAATDSTCGMKIVERIPFAGFSGANEGAPGGTPPVRVGERMYFAAESGKLYCLEAATADPCPTASIPHGLSTAPKGRWDVTTHGTRVFVARQGDKVACIDVAAGGACPGWETPKTIAGRLNVVNEFDASGNPIGVCAISGSNGDCIRDGDPGTVVTITGWPSQCCHYDVGAEAETGTRTLVGSLGRSGLGCFDWTTRAPCAGGDYAADGWISTGLPSAYGATWDGSCAVAVGDPGQVFTVDPAGVTPCLSLRTGTDRRAINLLAQRCDGTVGAARWRTVTVTDTSASEMSAVGVVVRDARTNEELARGDLLGGPLDISGIDPAAHPAIVVDATATTKSGAAPWDDGVPPRITIQWTSDPRQACLRTRTTAECTAAASTAGLELRAGLAGGATRTAGLRSARDACAVVGSARSQQPARPAARPARRCGGRRLFNIRIRFRGRSVRRISVTIDGRRQRQVRRLPRPVFRIDLRRRTKQRTVVRIRIVTTSGRVVTGRRVYNPCTKKRPGGIPKLR